MIKVADLPTIEKRAKEIFAELKKKYPILKANLVYSSKKGQCNLTSQIEAIFEGFSKAIIDSDAKQKALELIAQKKPLAAVIPETIRKDILLDSATMVELRFSDLNYDLIDILRKDTLVDRTITPQGTGSIRIVLGTLAGLMGSEG